MNCHCCLNRGVHGNMTSVSGYLSHRGNIGARLRVVPDVSEVRHTADLIGGLRSSVRVHLKRPRTGPNVGQEVPVLKNRNSRLTVKKDPGGLRMVSCCEAPERK
jgi:hypothetical protein